MSRTKGFLRAAGLALIAASEKSASTAFSFSLSSQCLCFGKIMPGAENNAP